MCVLCVFCVCLCVVRAPHEGMRAWLRESLRLQCCGWCQAEADCKEGLDLLDRIEAGNVSLLPGATIPAGLRVKVRPALALAPVPVPAKGPPAVCLETCWRAPWEGCAPEPSPFTPALLSFSRRGGQVMAWVHVACVVCGGLAPSVHSIAVLAATPPTHTLHPCCCRVRAAALPAWAQL